MVLSVKKWSMVMAGVKLLRDSTVFKESMDALEAKFAEQIAEVASNSFTDAVQNLPNEANGDAVPESGLYVSGGVLKVA
jgi:hypothetical protein